jgi:hypothetical protein
MKDEHAGKDKPKAQLPLPIVFPISNFPIFPILEKV